MVGVAVSILIVICATMFFVMGGFGLLGGEKTTRPDGKGETLVGRVRYRAEDIVCKQQLDQVRGMVMIETDSDEVRPATLKDAGVSDLYARCPIGKEPYEYDATTGEVECPHAGHEDY
jgi:hypothetical protein